MSTEDPNLVEKYAGKSQCCNAETRLVIMRIAGEQKAIHQCQHCFHVCEVWEGLRDN